MVRILAVDQQAVARVGLKSIVEVEPDLQIVADCGDAAEGLRLALSLAPDVAVVDLLFPGAEGFGLIKDLRARLPQTRILVWSLSDSTLYAAHCLRIGATGFVSKTQPPERLVEAIRRVAGGKVYVDEAQAGELLAQFLAASSKPGSPAPQPPSDSSSAPNPAGAAAFASQPVDIPATINLLTPAELEVLHLVGQGHTTREIAQMLHRSIKTIETYRSRIRSKLGLTNPTQFAQLAWRVVHSSGIPDTPPNLG